MSLTQCLTRSAPTVVCRTVMNATFRDEGDRAGRIGILLEHREHQRCVAQRDRRERERNRRTRWIARWDTDVDEGAHGVGATSDADRAEPSRRAAQQLLKADVLVRE